MKCQLGRRTVVGVEASQAGLTETAPVYKMEIPAVVLDRIVQRMPLMALNKVESRQKGYLHTVCAMLIRREDEPRRIIRRARILAREPTKGRRTDEAVQHTRDPSRERVWSYHEACRFLLTTLTVQTYLTECLHDSFSDTWPASILLYSRLSSENHGFLAFRPLSSTASSNRLPDFILYTGYGIRLHVS